MHSIWPKRVNLIVHGALDNFFFHFFIAKGLKKQAKRETRRREISEILPERIKGKGGVPACEARRHTDEGGVPACIAKGSKNKRNAKHALLYFSGFFITHPQPHPSLRIIHCHRCEETGGKGK